MPATNASPSGVMPSGPSPPDSRLRPSLWIERWKCQPLPTPSGVISGAKDERRPLERDGVADRLAREQLVVGRRERIGRVERELELRPAVLGVDLADAESVGVEVGEQLGEELAHVEHRVRAVDRAAVRRHGLVGVLADEPLELEPGLELVAQAGGALDDALERRAVAVLPARALLQPELAGRPGEGRLAGELDDALGHGLDAEVARRACRRPRRPSGCGRACRTRRTGRSSPCRVRRPRRACRSARCASAGCRWHRTRSTVSARTPLAFNSAARAARSVVLTGAPSDGCSTVRSGEGTPWRRAGQAMRRTTLPKRSGSVRRRAAAAMSSSACTESIAGRQAPAAMCSQSAPELARAAHRRADQRAPAPVEAGDRDRGVVAARVAVVHDRAAARERAPAPAPSRRRRTSRSRRGRPRRRSRRAPARGHSGSS